MITNENKKLAQWAMEYALKNGCQASRINLYYGSNASFEVRDMKIDRLEQASENSMSIQLFVDGRYGTYSTNRLVRQELERFIKEGIDATRYLAEDKARTLPEASRYYRGGQPDLEMNDPRYPEIQPDEKVALAMQTCDEIMGKDKRIISSSSSYSDGQDARYMIASNGFEGESQTSYYSVTGSVSIRGEGEARPESYWYDSSLYYDTLIKKGIGTKALERVMQKMGQRKVASGSYPMVVDNLNISRLLSPILNALYGSSIQQKNSFLLDKIGEKVFGENFTLTDEPHLIKSPGARYFDGEGVATQRRPIFENGILKTYYIDTYNANKMNVQPTISSPSILTMPLGKKDTNGLVAMVDRGILVTGFNGGNSNSTTGDFSFGVEGFLIENGKLTQPVSEMNITGNLLTLCNHILEIGNDPRLSSSWRIPSMLFDGVDFSGL
ncbi:TldD/PmbA family protein [Parabacteroides sp. PF5-6]|uniref:TldD/PmbA family protein n=1 Tax=Parabacteroides sp. PF5-6 TaxID=1742403 RepID=UPI002405C2B9|nr:TldD/PmbA family protein [Parabacteroides sp. PF5-6]MDF9829644.1 PmbA protein [Parabacteroides sp. PF5-6]